MSNHNGGTMDQSLEDIRSDMKAVQDALNTKIVDITVAEGAIRIQIDGNLQVRTLEIQRDRLSGISIDELDWLQNMLIKAFNQAVNRGQALAMEEFKLLSVRRSSQGRSL